MKNVKALPNIEADKFAAALEAMKRNLGTHLELQAIMAKIRRESYLRHIDEGFTPEQALILCQKVA